MQTRIFTSFNELPNSYEQLFDKTTIDSIFYSLPWFTNLAYNVFSDHDIRIICASSETDKNTTGAMVCFSERNREMWLAPRYLAGLQNYYSSLFAPLVCGNSDQQQSTVQALIDATQNSSEKWDILEIKPLPLDNNIFTQLETSLKKSNYATQSYFCFGNWYLDVAGRSFEEYVASLPSKLKNTIRRKTNRLKKNHEYRIDFVCEPGDKLEKAIADYVAIYNKSWKKPEPYKNFIPELLRTCAEHGWLRLGVLYIEDVPAAAQIWTVNHGKAYIYKLAYDNEYGQYSAGSILTMFIMEHVIDVDKVHEVDYLTGDDAYKKDWMSDRRERWGIRAYNMKTIKGRLLHFADQIKSKVKKLSEKPE